MLKIVYFGTPSFSADLLEKLILSNLVEVALVVTQPDKPVGREQTMTPSPVKLIAQKYHIEVFDHDELSELPELLITKNIDFGLLYSFGFKQWLTADLLASPKMKFGNTGFGFLNIHPSLLPKYRGASPIVFPLLLGDTETGVSLMVMDEKMDHGPLLAQEKLAITKNDTTQTLTTKLTDLAFDVVSNFISQYLIPNTQYLITPQDHLQASFARFLTRDDGFISLNLIKKALHNEPITSSELPEIYKWYSSRNNQQPTTNNQQSSVDIIDRMFRALSPWPGLWTTIMVNGQPKRLIIKQQAINKKPASQGERGEQLVISRVQLEGKNEVDFETFNKAYKLM